MVVSILHKIQRIKGKHYQTNESILGVFFLPSFLSFFFKKSFCCCCCSSINIFICLRTSLCPILYFLENAPHCTSQCQVQLPPSRLSVIPSRAWIISWPLCEPLEGPAGGTCCVLSVIFTKIPNNIHKNHQGAKNILGLQNDGLYAVHRSPVLLWGKYC